MNSHQINRARIFRRAANAPEQAAWNALRQLRQHGFPVRRQHPIGPYIVDFALASKKLAIEIDGTMHNREEMQVRDAKRQEALEQLGWRVIRFTGDEAFHADHLIDTVLRMLEQ